MAENDEGGERVIGSDVTEKDGRIADVEKKAQGLEEDEDADVPADLRHKIKVSPGVQLRDTHIDFPEGGFVAWTVLIGAVFQNISCFGYATAWGVFQAYYEQHLLKHMSPSAIAWIGSTQYSIMLALCLFTGRLFDIGYFRIPLIAASIVLVAATCLTAHCTQYWQFVLCQGVLIGLAAGFVFGSNLAVVSHYFNKRRAMAVGIAACGSSIGGTIFPIMVQRLIPRIGFPWTTRALGLFLLVNLTIANVCLRRRLPPIGSKGGLFNLSAFKFLPCTIYTMASFVGFMGVYTVLTFIDVAAAKAQIAPSFNVYFLTIANASSAFGRVSMGLLASRVGCLTVTIPGTILVAAVTFAWPYAKDFPSLLVISILYGFSSGTFAGLISVPLIHMGETADVGRRIGTLLTALSLAPLIGPPISGAISDRTGGYTNVGYYAGSTLVLAAAMMWFVRYKMTGKLFGGKF